MYAKLLNNLETLKLEKMYSYIPNYLDTVVKEGTSVLDALVHLTDKEIAYKNEMASKIQITVAGFPFVKRAEHYDYDFQPSVNKTQIKDLCSLRFIENKENKPEVNHKDGNKLNNHVSNLEWNTTQENLEHKRINNLGKTLKAKLSATGINNSQAKLDEEDVIFIRTNCETIIDIKKFSKELDVSIATIYDIKNRRSWTHI